MVYNKLEAKRYLANVRNAASEKHYYNLSNEIFDKLEPSLNAREKIENSLSYIEGVTKPILDKLINICRENANHINALILGNELDRMRLSFFLALQIVRVPKYRDDLCRSFEGFKKQVREVLSTIDESTYSEDIKQLLCGDPEKIAREIQLSQLTSLEDEIIMFIFWNVYNWKWTFFTISISSSFLTSDNPISINSLNNIKNPPLLHDGCFLEFSISHDILAVIYPQNGLFDNELIGNGKNNKWKNRMIKINNPEIGMPLIDKVNRNICRNSHERIYANPQVDSQYFANLLTK